MTTRIPPNTNYASPPPQFPMQNNDYGIGVALGSPRLAPVPSQDPRRVPRVMTTITSPAAVTTEPSQQPKTTGLSRSLSKRLPFLGRSKSRRRNSNSSSGGGNNYSQPSADLGNTNYITKSTPPVPSPPAPTSPRPANQSLGASSSMVRPEAAKLKKPKPVAVRSVTDPQMQSPRGRGVGPQRSAWQPGQPGPVLDVEIPDIKLDRYSVMFGSLLEQERSVGGLLARRQARTQDARDEEKRGVYVDLQRSRRATSPSMTPSQPPIAELELAGDSPPGINVAPLRLRSNTFPMIDREAEEMPAEELQFEKTQYEGQSDSVATSILSPNSQLSSGRDSEDRPRLHSRFHKPSVESIRSPYFRQGAERENSTALSPPPAINRYYNYDGSLASSPSYAVMPPSKQVDIPSRSTSLHRPLNQFPAAPKPHPKPTSREEALEDAAEVSIARQISISRQQRRFLEPLQERELRRARANQHIKAASQISMDGDKRIAETKTATPVFIHPERQIESPQNLYRRSERVTIEGA